MAFESINGPPGPLDPASSKKLKPKKYLPTNRVNFSNQLDILRAYAVASQNGSKAVANSDIAGMVKLNSDTVSLCNSFFVDSGFLLKGEGGYIPSGEVQAYARTYQFDPERASQKLAPLLERTWFGQAILPKVDFRSLDEAEALTILADAAAADISYKAQLRMILEYLTAADVVQREGNMIKRIPRSSSAFSPYGDAIVSAHLNVQKPIEQSPEIPVYVQQPANALSFSVDIKIDMAELSGWSADRINALFGGLAQVIAAKGSMPSKE
jgi:hypothetical protein